MKRGAIGVFNLVRLPGNELSRDFSDCGNPCFNIRGRDGLFLETILDRAAQAGVQDKLRVKIDLQTQTWATLKAAKVNVRQALPLYHTTGEVLDVISTPGLEQIARVLANLVSRPTRRRRKGSTRETTYHAGNASPRRQRVDRGLRGAAEKAPPHRTSTTSPSRKSKTTCSSCAAAAATRPCSSRPTASRSSTPRTRAGASRCSRR